MKENVNNIEEIFKQKFDNFQPEVNPSVWAGIQAGLGTTAAVTTGVSVAIKIGIISGGIIAASIATWYFGFYEPETPAAIISQQSMPIQPEESNETDDAVIVVNDLNDPVIIENEEKIKEELKSHQSGTEIVDGPISHVSVTPPQDNTSAGVSATETGNNSTSQNPVITENVNEEEVKNKPTPTGRMEFVQSNAYAPSEISFSSNAQNHKEVRWDFGDGTTAEGVTVRHTYSKPGKYAVKMIIVGSEKANYEEVQEIVVKSKSSIDNVPNVITPNGDRINDYFSVKSTDIETFMISIRDNRGNEIFNSTDKDFVWDGTDFSGVVVEKGMYTYLIIAEGKDGSVIKLPGQIYVQ